MFTKLMTFTWMSVLLLTMRMVFSEERLCVKFSSDNNNSNNT